ncbi:hypothetical protein CLU99_1769 [Flavobacterium sp. 2]|nr:hypothetical protein CLU99_1769 [Flavobacterium sp. 2]
MQTMLFSGLGSFLQPPKISAYNKITMDLLILNDLLIEF